MRVYLEHYKTTIELTDEQERLVEKAVNAFRSGEQLFQYAAPAGCGKSVVLHVIINQLGYDEDQIAPMAYMGSAAMVMRKNGFKNAKTCHSWLFNPIMDPYVDPLSGKTKYKIKFIPLPLNREEIKLIVIDEASMVPIELRRVIEANHIPVLVCGDLDQLQPVASRSAYLTTGKVERLTKIMRQSAQSSIITISNLLRNNLRPSPGDYGDVLVIPYECLTNDMLLQAEAIICGYNSTRDDITKYVRSLIGFRGPLPYYGERVVCRKNNWDETIDGISLVNGMIGTCVSRDNSISKMKSEETFSMDFQPLLFPEITFTDLNCDYEYFIANHSKRQEIKQYEMSHRTYITKNKFEFGYAITTHMSQGNQYKHGIYIEQPFGDRKLQSNLNYTGITRFMDHCIYVLPGRKRVSMPPLQRSMKIKKCVLMTDGQFQM